MQSLALNSLKALKPINLGNQMKIIKLAVLTQYFYANLYLKNETVSEDLAGSYSGWRSEM